MINAGHIPAVSNSLFGFEGIIFFSLMYLDNCIEEATWKRRVGCMFSADGMCGNEVKVIRAYGGCLGAKSR